MARNSFNINIILKGFEKANSNLKKTTSSINKVGAETKKTKAATDKYKEANKKLKAELEKLKKNLDRTRISTAGLRREIGAIRNNFLLIAFAVGGVVGVMRKFVNASSGFQSVKARLVGLTGGVEQAEEAFNVFNQVAATTPFQLQDVVNAGAQLEAFGVDSKATLRSVTDLASFMGTSATDAANALGRAFAGGAGAADILREKGILNIIKDFKGIDDITDLTLPQFRQALMEAMIEPAVGIEGSSERMSQTFEGAVSNMLDASTRFAAKIGDLILDDLTELVNKTEDWIRALDVKRIAEITAAIATLGAAVAILRIEATIMAYYARYLATGVAALAGPARALGMIVTVLAMDQFFKLTGTFEAFGEEVKSVDDVLKDHKKQMEGYAKKVGTVDEKLKNAKESAEELRKSIEDNEESLINKIASLEAEKAALQGLSMEEQERLRLMRSLSAAEKVSIREVEKLTKEIKELKKAQKDLKDEERDSLKAKEDRLKLEEKMRSSLIDIKNESLRIQAQLDGADDREIEAMELKDELIKRIISDTGSSVAMYEALNDELTKNVTLQGLTNLELANGIELTPEYINQLVLLFQRKNELAESTAGLSQEEQNLISLENQLTVALMEQAVAMQEATGAREQDIAQSNLHIKLWTELKNAVDEVRKAGKELDISMEGMDWASKERDEFFDWLIQFSDRSKTLQENIDAASLAVGDNLGEQVALLSIKLRTGVIQIETASSGIKAAEQNSKKAAQALAILAGAVEGLGPPADKSNKQLKAMLRTMGQLATLAGAPIVGGFLQLGAAFAHTGGLIRNDGIQRFAAGGTVQGQDNVPIMAQAGEFVMRREAVQNIGVQNLAEMNQTGSAAPSVTVNIQGNMVGNESFVRDTLIPEITRAQRQNLA